MKFLALLSSMPFESDQILARLKNVRTLKIAGKTAYKGRLSGLDLILLNTGVGKVNAAHSATCIIEYFSIKNIINLGVGGAYPGSGLEIGDIAIALKEIYGDEGIIDQKGWHSLKKIGIPVVQTRKKKYFNEFPLNPPSPPRDRVVPTFYKGGNKIEKRSIIIKYGNFVTVSATTASHKRAKELKKRFHAISENMEGAAIAQVCTIYKIPMLEIRGISNTVGVRDKRKWNLKLASANCQKVVLDVIDRL